MDFRCRKVSVNRGRDVLIGSRSRYGTGMPRYVRRVRWDDSSDVQFNAGKAEKAAEDRQTLFLVERLTV